MAPREVDGCNKLWKRAGAEVQNFDVWTLGPQPAERGVLGPKKGVPCGARETDTNPAQPIAPAVSRAPRASPPAIPIAGSCLALFFSGVPAPKTD